MFNLPQIEEKILKFWKDQNIFKKSLQKPADKGDFVFYDGPPFATGTPHYGHIVASLMKDIVPRYWTMRGYHVERRWGWDCHGLPIENIVEEELKIKSKRDIEEKIGIDRFNEICRSKVLIYAEEWRRVVERMGRWADMDNDYKTMDKDYMESIWWVFKQLWDKGLIYEGYKSMHICPRCETTLSQSEVSQGYQDVKDLAVTVKFRIKNQESRIKSEKINGVTYILAWTTTPWTLIGNVALAVGEEISYLVVRDKEQGENYILAKDLAEKVLGYTGTGSLVPTKIGTRDDIIIKGKDLAGLKYEPLFDYYESGLSARRSFSPAQKENLYTIQTADFVSTEEGTGVVHIAPAFGEDDMNLGKEKNLPFIQHVGMDGRIKTEVKDFAGLEVKPKDDPLATDKKIIEYLKKKNSVFNVEKYSHSYPYCWRCDSPLLNYAASSWFVNVEKIKKQALKTAKNINWAPSHIKEGRFGKWLEGARDWSISRQRFWGSVLPIWKCDRCGQLEVFGSVEELKKRSGKELQDLHKHFVDKIEFSCNEIDPCFRRDDKRESRDDKRESRDDKKGECSGIMRRIPDVLDCWFESGSMPYAQMHYPFENKRKFEKNFPAQFIAEGVDQTRAWFYYMHILANAIKNSEAFKNVIVNGIVLAEDGKKMSKKLKNYPDPMQVMHKYGADTVRYYLCASQVMKADNLNFSESDAKEQAKFFNTLFNVLSFYQMYENQFSSAGHWTLDTNLENVLDKWIAAKLNLLIKNVTEKMNNYDLHAIREFPVFINDLSTWYVRRSRDRFKGDDKQDKNAAIYTLGKVLFELSKLMAPFMPFTAEHIYQELGKECKCLKESAHLETWPEVNKKLIDQKVLDYMALTRKVVEMALAERAEVGIKVRQPLSELRIKNQELRDEYLDLIKDEVNVKEVVREKGSGVLSVKLSLEISPEMKQEGLLRELVRTINQMRKKNNLTIQDRIKIEYNTQINTDEKADECRYLKSVFEKFDEELKKQTLADEVSESSGKLEKVKVNGKEISIKITKK